MTTERPSPYERLEFLGDSVLGFTIANLLYEEFPQFAEGELTRIRAATVSRKSCAVVARQLGLHEGFADTWHDEALRRSDNVLAAVVEVAIAVCFLQYGLETVRPAVAEAFRNRIEEALAAPADFKTRLQEALARRAATVRYVVEDASGPPHDRTFTCVAVIDDQEVGRGRGRSKKEAEQEAAREALEREA
jgi:ribonuclease III